MKKVIIVLLSVLLVVSLFSCTGVDNTTSISLLGNLGDSLSSRSMDTQRMSRAISANEIWIVEIPEESDSGLFANGIFNNKVTSTIMEDGSFDISTEGLPMAEGSKFLVVLLDTNLPNKKDHIQSFVAFDGGEWDNLITMPLSELTEDLNLGTLESNVDGDEAVSGDVPVSEVSNLTSIDFELLKIQARADNAYKGIINQYINLREDGSAPWANMLFTLIGSVVGSEISVNAWNTGYVELWMNNMPLVDPYSSWTTEEYQAHIDNENWEIFSGEVVFIAPDSTESDGKIGNFYGDGTGMYYIYFDNATDVADGFYKIEDADTGALLAEYDYSYDMIFDAEGTPYIPVPSISLQKDNDPYSSITLDWYFFSPSGTTKQITDYENLIEQVNPGFQFDNDPYSDLQVSVNIDQRVINIDSDLAAANASGFRILYDYNGINIELAISIP